MQTVPPLSPAARGKTHSLAIGVVFMIAAFMAALVPFVERSEVYAITLAMLFCLVTPAWLRFQNGQGDAFETINLVGLLHFSFFGLGAIWAITDPNVSARDRYLFDYIPRAALLALFGYLMMLAGYFGPWARRVKRETIEEWPRGSLFLAVTGGIGLVGALAQIVWARAYWSNTTVAIGFSALAQLQDFYWFAWGLSWILYFSGRASRNQRLLHFGFFVPSGVIVLGANLTSKFIAITVVGLVVVAYWYARRRLPWRVFAALLLLTIFVVFPFFNTFRNFDARRPMEERVGMTTEAISEWDLPQYLDHSVGAFKSRLSLINQFAVVMRDVPRWVPYANGGTIFLPTVHYMIPRVLWPGKPRFLFGREFALTFRVVDVVDKKTSITATVPGELFWNFDLPGVLIGMAIWGIAMRWLYERYGATRGIDPVRRAIHILILTHFALFGAGIAAQSAVLIRTILLLEAFRWLGRRLGWLEQRAD